MGICYTKFRAVFAPLVTVAVRGERLGDRVDVPIEDGTPLFFRAQARVSHHASGLCRGCRHSAPSVSSERTFLWKILFGLFHVDQLRSQVE